MNFATKQGFRLCMVIGMSFSISSNVLAQDIAKNDPSHTYQTSNTTVRALTVGDRVPDLQFQNVLNYKAKKARLSDFKGKLIILDMWSTWCSSCIAAFPKMEALQKKFGDRIQILLVDSYKEQDPTQKIIRGLEKMRERTGFFPTLPIPIHDTILNDYFPHASVPHIILIDSNNKVIAITTSTFVTEENIAAILAGENLNFPLKNDWSFNKDLPLFAKGNGGNGEDFIYRSVITKYNDKLGTRIGRNIDDNGKVFRMFVINYPLLSLFQIAYTNVFKFPRNRTFIEVENPTRFRISSDALELQLKSYCYEIITSPVNEAEIIRYMQEDLYRNFHAIAKVERRLMKCYLLKTNQNIEGTFTKGGISEVDYDKTTLRKHIHNRPVSELISALNIVSSVPIVDQSGLTKNIDVELPFDFFEYDLTKIKNFLSTIGFDLIETNQDLEVAVISDK